MVVNLNFDDGFVCNSLKDIKESDVLDFAGISIDFTLAGKIHYARNLDPGHWIEKDSIERYIKTIGELSRSDLRNIVVNKFPIWWRTNISEKNNRLHWGKIVFFFLEFSYKRHDFFKEDIIIILPSNFGYLDQFIIDNISKDVSSKLSFIYPPKSVETRVGYVKKTLKGIILYLGFRMKIMFKSSTIFNNENVFLIAQYDAVAENSTAFDIGWHKREIDKVAHLPSINLPIPSIFQLRNLKPCSKEVTYFLKKSPNTAILIYGFFETFIKTYFLKNKVKALVVNNIRFTKELLLSELKHASYEIDTLLCVLWFRNFVQGNQSLNYYYSDELYRSGRLLSFSLKGNNTVGVQHGLIAKNHGVYRVSPDETKGENALPTPNKLLMWNKLFGSIIESTNKELYKKVIYSNDLHYQSLIEKVAELRKNREKSNRVNVLWAITLWPHFVSELDIIRPIFDDPKKEVTLRFHPLKRYINRERVVKKLDGLNYTTSKRSFEEDMANSDLIITNAFSTIFYDAMKLKIPVLRIENPGTYCDLEIKKEDVNSIYSREEFMGVLKKYNK